MTKQAVHRTGDRHERHGRSTRRVRAGMSEVLAGRLKGPRAALLFAGPAVIASVAYMDPGNYATNIQAGAGYGYALLWVVVLANVIAILFQALSAKLGIVTGRNLAEMCRERFPGPVVFVMWVVSEIAAMATDLAEFLGGAIGLALLFNMPLIWGMGVTAIVTYAILMFEARGFRPMEMIIGAFVALIGACYLVELAIAPVDWGAAAGGILGPELPDATALTIAVGIIGATVMPHAIYLHSGLTQNRAIARTDAERRIVLRYSNREVVVALALAGLINMAMVIMAAGAFHSGHPEVAEIETAYHMLTPLLGGAAAAVFLVSLIASGVSSSVVGTMSGQMIMQGFLRWHIPIWLRRLVTMVPAFAVVAAGVDATRALVLSQVILSIALPVPMIALLIFTSSRAVMGDFVNSPVIRAGALLGAAVVLTLNTVLLAEAFGIDLGLF
ncbi:Nramp family divalent metal transporter [Phaeovulum vinaykumarii]|uniref:Divalent metal cation transporter MntH n=1 Tax=Phaeovulum vinaykumarii TaxID=407234 RepID=A0A1N7M4P8_9RHOB|nr:Nramp family divalent metal transporter [Phaeovulum vinaykumarii]SIS81012.1 manganese transport protein [Phaeovulum vinaykumarii]SOC08754.1 manganese transport protein [Phaeovulum vinaykumarii]